MAAGLVFAASKQTSWSALPETGAPAAALAAQAPANTLFKHVSGDVYELGGVRLNKKERSISFPATVNMQEGAVEYALVHATGKVHESVLKTDADPLHIQLARLLVWPETDTGKTGPEDKADWPRELMGPKMTVSVTWRANAAGKEAQLEDLVLNTLTKSRMTPGDWVYNGSRVVEGTFLAQRDGSIVAIIADPDALVNNPRPGRNDDEIWTVNSPLTPAQGTPVTVTMQLTNNHEK